ncbi:MAG: pantoate--beta-alanine ligase, partial [Gemmatimonadaceae bacterium]|nr:pantoate--beta-alanine ligase [Caulobacter sp.]
PPTPSPRPEDPPPPAPLPTPPRPPAEAVAAGGRIDDAEAVGKTALINAGFRQIDYFDVREASGLSRLGPGPIGDAQGRILVAAWLGKTRLIDNMGI